MSNKSAWQPQFDEIHSSVQEAEGFLQSSNDVQKAIDEVHYPDSLNDLSEISKNLYISSWKTASELVSTSDKGIDYTLSAMSINPNLSVPEQQHLWLQIEDSSSQNILQYFEKSNKFIAFALSKNAKVLVHCFAGISRSVTLVAAYLMKENNWNTEEALSHINERRSGISPNANFLRQLRVYFECNYQLDRSLRPYRQWLFRRYGDFAVLNTRVPSEVAYAETVRARAGQLELRCKKCRFVLASSDYLVSHEPKDEDNYSHTRCTHYFLEPIRWMQPELELGNLEGRFDCPKCNSKIGSYKWQGLQCSCLQWVCPALSILQSRVDAVRKLG